VLHFSPRWWDARLRSAPNQPRAIIIIAKEIFVIIILYFCLPLDCNSRSGREYKNACVASAHDLIDWIPKMATHFDSRNYLNSKSDCVSSVSLSQPLYYIWRRLLLLILYIWKLSHQINGNGKNFHLLRKTFFRQHLLESSIKDNNKIWRSTDVCYCLEHLNIFT